MTANRNDGGALIVQFARTQIGKPYSEQSPPGSFADGHLWQPGDPLPLEYDCSGLTHTSAVEVGISAFSPGNANDQWLQRLGGLVPDSEPLRPGDFGAFLGSENTPGYAGHTGIVATYNPATKEGTLVNAYDTQMGVCEIPFTRPQITNGNGLGVLGFYRPANVLPLPPTKTAVPSAQVLASHGYTLMVDHAMAVEAVNNGWQLYVWNGFGFSNAVANEPVGTHEYASVHFRTKHP